MTPESHVLREWIRSARSDPGSDAYRQAVERVYELERAAEVRLSLPVHPDSSESTPRSEPR